MQQSAEKFRNTFSLTQAPDALAIHIEWKKDVNAGLIIQ